MRFFICCVFAWFLGRWRAGASNALPCCHLSAEVTPVEHHFPVLNLTDIRIGMCHGLHIADLEATRGTPRVKLLRCGNGYSVVSFLVALLEEVCLRGASEPHLALLRDLRELRSRFDPGRVAPAELDVSEGR